MFFDRQALALQNRLLPTLLWMVLLCSCVEAAIIVSVVEESAASSHSDPVLRQGGFGEDAVAFSDRLHQWNGISTSNTNAQPTLAGLGLVGADYVQTANNARAVSSNDAAYSITLSEEARVFLFMDTRQTEPAWMAEMGFSRIASTSNEGYYQVGYDEGQTTEELGVGPGVSINTRAWIYSAKLGAGTHTFKGQVFSGHNNYGIVATGGNTVVGGVARMHGSTPHPQLQRQGLGNLAKAYVDRNHRIVLQSSILDALPQLNGADLLQLSNDVRATPLTTPLYEVSLLEDAYAYLFLDDRYAHSGAESLNWIAAMGFTDTLLNAGIDETGDGNSDRNLSIFRAYLTQGAYRFNGMEFGDSNHYILAFHAVPEPSKAGLAFASCLVFAMVRRHRPSSSC